MEGTRDNSRITYHVRTAAVILAVPALIVAAILTGSIGILILAVVMIVLIIIAAVLNQVNAARFSAEVDVTESTSDGDLVATVRIINHSGFPVLKGMAKITAKNLNFGFEESYTAAFSAAAHDGVSVRFRIGSNYCGRYRVVLKGIKCLDAFGLSSKTVCKGLEASGCMLPGRYALSSISEAVKVNYEKERKFANRKNHNLSEILQYRDYQKGDSLKNVNWKLSVKHDRLLVREFDTPIDNQLLLVLDITEGPAEYRNMAYSVFFSISNEYARYNYPHQMCWPEAGTLKYGNAESVDDSIRIMKEILSDSVRPSQRAADLLVLEGDSGKYARILYITNRSDRNIEYKLKLCGNAELFCVDDRHFTEENFRSVMRHLAV